MDVYSEALGMSGAGNDGKVVSQESYCAKLQSAFGGILVGPYAIETGHRCSAKKYRKHFERNITVYLPNIHSLIAEHQLALDVRLLNLIQDELF